MATFYEQAREHNFVQKLFPNVMQKESSVDTAHGGGGSSSSPNHKAVKEALTTGMSYLRKRLALQAKGLTELWGRKRGGTPRFNCSSSKIVIKTDKNRNTLYSCNGGRVLFDVDLKFSLCGDDVFLYANKLSAVVIDSALRSFRRESDLLIMAFSDKLTKGAFVDARVCLSVVRSFGERLAQNILEGCRRERGKLAVQRFTERVVEDVMECFRNEMVVVARGNRLVVRVAESPRVNIELGFSCEAGGEVTLEASRCSSEISFGKGEREEAPAADSLTVTDKDVAAVSKSPVTVQEWVNAIDVRADNEEAECSGNRACTRAISVDTDDVTLGLGAEARLLHQRLTNGSHCKGLPSPADDSVGDKAVSVDEGVRAGADQWDAELQKKRQGLHKAHTQHFSFQSSCSSISSVDTLLESMREDPEEVLLNLGFGGGSSDSYSRLPKRFLKPSKIPGNNLDNFISCQNELDDALASGLSGYKGLAGCIRDGRQPQGVMGQILDRMKEQAEMKRRISMAASQSLESPPSNKSSTLSFSHVAMSVMAVNAFRAAVRPPGMSILAPENREFLDKQDSRLTDSVKPRRRLVIGQEFYTIDREGNMVSAGNAECKSPVAVSARKKSLRRSSLKGQVVPETESPPPTPSAKRPPALWQLLRESPVDVASDSEKEDFFKSLEKQEDVQPTPRNRRGQLKRLFLRQRSVNAESSQNEDEEVDRHSSLPSQFAVTSSGGEHAKRAAFKLGLDKDSKSFELEELSGHTDSTGRCSSEFRDEFEQDLLTRASSAHSDSSGFMEDPIECSGFSWSMDSPLSADPMDRLGVPTFSNRSSESNLSQETVVCMPINQSQRDPSPDAPKREQSGVSFLDELRLDSGQDASLCCFTSQRLTDNGSPEGSVGSSRDDVSNTIMLTEPSSPNQIYCSFTLPADLLEQMAVVTNALDVYIGQLTTLERHAQYVNKKLVKLLNENELSDWETVCELRHKAMEAALNTKDQINFQKTVVRNCMEGKLLPSERRSSLKQHGVSLQSYVHLSGLIVKLLDLNLDMLNHAMCTQWETE